MAVVLRKHDDLPGNYHSQRPDVFRYLPESARMILDVGCGEGGFGELIKQGRDAEVWGVELDPEVAEKAKKRLDRVFVGNIETDRFDLPEEYFDCIVLNDVLEHLYYPWDVLERLKKYLKTDGHVIASIPNIRYYVNLKKFVLKGEWEYESSGVMDRTHIRFFTLKSMRKMFERCSYRDIRIEGLYYIALPWKLNLLNKLMGNRLDDIRYMQYLCLAKK